jgi:hypothetical protein
MFATYHLPGRAQWYRAIAPCSWLRENINKSQGREPRWGLNKAKVWFNSGFIDYCGGKKLFPTLQVVVTFVPLDFLWWAWTYATEIQVAGGLLLRWSPGFTCERLLLRRSLVFICEGLLLERSLVLTAVYKRASPQLCCFYINYACASVATL